MAEVHRGNGSCSAVRLVVVCITLFLCSASIAHDWGRDPEHDPSARGPELPGTPLVTDLGSGPDVDVPGRPVEIAPYLVQLTPTSAVLCWLTGPPVRSRGRLTSVGSAIEFVDDVVGRRHCREFRNLQSFSTYHYDIDGVFSGTFKTPEELPEFRVVALGHTHGSESPGHYPDEFLIGRVSELRPEFVIHTGDSTWNAQIDDFARYFFSLFRQILASRPVYIAPGNHDMGRGGFSAFRWLFPHDYGSEAEGYYGIDYKHVRFLFLSYMTLGIPGSRQIDWLEEQLSQSNHEFNIVVWGGAQAPESRASQLFEILKRHRVDLLLGGDGYGVRFDSVGTIPYAFIGTSAEDPHSLLLLNFGRFEVHVQRFDAQGRAYGTPLHILTQRPHSMTRDLFLSGNPVTFKSPSGRPRTVTRGDRLPNLASGSLVEVAGLSTASEELDGVRFTIDCVGSGRGMGRIQWTSAEATKSGLRVPHQTQYFYLEPGVHQYIAALPDVDPLTEQAYHLTSIRLAVDLPACANGARITSFELFADEASR